MKGKTKQKVAMILAVIIILLTIWNKIQFSQSILVETSTSGGWILPGFSRYYQVKPKNGMKKRVSRLKLFIIDKDNGVDVNYKLMDTYDFILPDYLDGGSIIGMLNDTDLLIEAYNLNSKIFQIYSYNIETHEYTYIVDHLGISSLAHNGKIYYLELGEHQWIYNLCEYTVETKETRIIIEDIKLNLNLRIIKFLE